MNPVIRTLHDLHPALVAAAAAAQSAYVTAKVAYSREELASIVGVGGDGTPTMKLDQIVDEAVLTAVDPFGVNILSEEVGWVDRGSAVTLVMDPVDGTANAVADIPVCAFAGAICIGSQVVDSHLVWLDSQRFLSAHRNRHGEWELSEPLRTSRRTSLASASISVLRPRPHTRSAWDAVVRPTERLRVMGSSIVEGSLVALGSIDAFADVGGDVHRIVDLLPLVPFIECAGGSLVDLHSRPVEFDTDLEKRWSGIAAASRPLADEIVRTALGA
jgi:myo-inositol-1(or 4)-monophosphatase